MEAEKLGVSCFSWEEFSSMVSLISYYNSLRVPRGLLVHYEYHDNVGMFCLDREKKTTNFPRNARKIFVRSCIPAEQLEIPKA